MNMSYVKRPLRRDLAPDHESLVRELIQELKPQTLAQAAMKDKNAPVIIEEQMRNSDRLQVYVKWEKWAGVREDHRGAAILDAFEKALGQEYARRIIIAMGVTPEEAEDLGIQE
jgi:hypothetical protein